MLFCLLSAFYSNAAVTAIPYEQTNRSGYNLPPESVPGKKLNRLQKKVLHFIQKKLAGKMEKGYPDAKQRRQAKWSMILGIFSFVALFTPVAILAIPAAIIGLILGIKSVDGNSNYQGIIGIVTSSATLLLFLLILALVAFWVGFG